jgi:hypothetical protein
MVCLDVKLAWRKFQSFAANLALPIIRTLEFSSDGSVADNPADFQSDSWRQIIYININGRGGILIELSVEIGANHFYILPHHRFKI